MFLLAKRNVAFSGVFIEFASAKLATDAVVVTFVTLLLRRVEVSGSLARRVGSDRLSELHALQLPLGNLASCERLGFSCPI